jgi:Anti-sigma factor NepR
MLSEKALMSGAFGRPGAWMSSALKAHYDELVRAPIPQRINELLVRLQSYDGSSSGKQR